MRVIAGEFRSRKLKTLPSLEVRPTPDRVREALFNVLAPRMEGVTFLDAYAGTGAVGIEALSRGAARAIFIEKNSAAVRTIRENLAALGVEDRATVVHGAVTISLPRFQADIYFLDPPYTEPGQYKAALNLLAGSEALVLAQHDKRHKLEETYGGLWRIRELKQGDNVISFFSSSPPANE